MRVIYLQQVCYDHTSGILTHPYQFQVPLHKKYIYPFFLLSHNYQLAEIVVHQKDMHKSSNHSRYKDPLSVKQLLDLSGKNSQQDILPYTEHLNNAYTLQILTFRQAYHLEWLQPFFYLFPMELHVRFYMLLHRRYTQYIFLHRIRISFVPFFKPSLS